MHPLVNDLTQIKDDELTHKISDLQKRLTQCYRFGPPSLIPQIQMVLQDYQSELQRRNAKAMEEMMSKASKDGKNFKGIIDIN